MTQDIYIYIYTYIHIIHLETFNMSAFLLENHWQASREALWPNEVQYPNCRHRKHSLTGILQCLNMQSPFCQVEVQSYSNYIFDMCSHSWWLLYFFRIEQRISHPSSIIDDTTGISRWISHRRCLTRLSEKRNCRQTWLRLWCATWPFVQRKWQWTESFMVGTAEFVHLFYFEPFLLQTPVS